MRIGERVIIDGYPATIVALPAERSFADDYPSTEWGHLKTGLLVVDDAAGLVHYPDLSALNIKHLGG